MPRGFVRSTRKWRELAQTNGPDCTARDPTAEAPLPAPASPSDQIEAVLRRAFDLDTADSPSAAPISGGMGIKVVPGSSPGSISVEFSDALTRLIWELSGGRSAAEAAGSRERVERVVCRLLNEKMVEGKARGGGEPRKPGGSLADVLTWLRELAVAPCDRDPAAGTRRDSMLSARRALFMPVDRLPDAEELPYRGNPRKRHKGRQFLCGTSSALTNSSEKTAMQLSKCCCSLTHPVTCIHDQCDYVNGSKEATEMFNQPRRRSERSLGVLKLGGSDVLRKRVPIGPFFQADVPEWTSTSNRKTMPEDDQKCGSRWLGTRLWPIGDNNNGRGTEPIGRGRPDLCSCCSPSSTMCVRYHVRMARIQLKSVLGRAFIGMGFHNMGEEVSNLWSRDQQRGFNTLVRLNPISENKTFWYHALRYFPSKTRQDVVSYYFNVHVPRRMSLQTKLPRESIDSDDDEWSGQATEALFPTYAEARHS